MSKDFITIYKDKPWFLMPFYVGTAVLFFFLLSEGIYNIYVDSNSEQLRFESSFNGEIEDINSQKRSYYIHLSNKNKWIKLEDIKNDSYPLLESKFLMGVLKKGDLLFKNENSDSIHFERDQRVFSFNIGNKD
ncbi:hypothetical protein [Urechidicola vernalis]|uniref:Uncharacterized protein n=1 Tax=Urechidicola vernalis TaxID=3075600 RepID=A0ABU2Y2F3_9FLAO|nr:hypothetical protein [Urechidicola sp. P050]MDT0552384.1 hypothetical protein [Urechidicola sp. P050]